MQIKKILKKEDIVKILILTTAFVFFYHFIDIGGATPLDNPPQENAYQPINKSGDLQTKEGGIIVNGSLADTFCLNSQCISNWDEICTKGYVDCK